MPESPIRAKQGRKGTDPMGERQDPRCGDCKYWGECHSDGVKNPVRVVHRPFQWGPCPVWLEKQRRALGPGDGSDPIKERHCRHCVEFTPGVFCRYDPRYCEFVAREEEMPSAAAARERERETP